MGAPFDIKAITADLQKVLNPIHKAKGLPNSCYADPGYFELERRDLFARTWACIGYAHDVPHKGDYRPNAVLGVPLLMLRDQNQQIRVFHNVCSHRGMILMEEPGHTNGVLRCPYHSWCYDLEGALKITPHLGGPGTNIHQDFDQSQHGLKAVRSAVFMGMVYVNLDGKAPAFEEHVAPLKARWAPFADQPLYSGEHTSFSFDVKCNWKLAVENYCESYHLPWVHPSLNSYSRLEDHYHIEAEGMYAGQGSTVYSPTLGDGAEQFHSLSNLSLAWQQGAEYIALFPNVLLGVHRDHAFGILLEPKAADQTHERIELFYYSEEDLAEAKTALRLTNKEMWHTVFKEDIFVVEGMQRGRHSPAFEGGAFSPVMDNPTHLFHKWVADGLLAA